MDKLRRSFRSSFKKNRDERSEEDLSKPKQWPLDQEAVKTNTCAFQVKYLGCVEVFESRGMQVCEEAVKLLKNSKRRSIKGMLHISSDGLRVVDEDTKGLVVDQTIEKVSFCAPDRNFERGFSYICRDGTTRRWMCHGFMAIKETGERLSHALGCAFAICLEKKQKRDQECSVTMTYDNNENTFTRMGSFRQGSITERLQDPQIFKQADPITPPKEPVLNPFAVSRPKPSNIMFQRASSLRGRSLDAIPFKRQLSLRLDQLPSNLERQNYLSEIPKRDGIETDQVRIRPGNLDASNKRSQIYSVPPSFKHSSGSAFSPIKEDAVNESVSQEEDITRRFSLLSSSDPFSPIHLGPSSSADPFSPVHHGPSSLPPSLLQLTTLGSPQTKSTSPVPSLQEKSDKTSLHIKTPLGDALMKPNELVRPASYTSPSSQHNQKALISPALFTNSASPPFIAPVQPKSFIPPISSTSTEIPSESINPWDHVPDQPNLRNTEVPCISKPTNPFCKTSEGLINQFPTSSVSSPYHKEITYGVELPASRQEDPLDSEWDILATRNNKNSVSTNPFRSSLA